MQANSREVVSNQPGLHPRLAQTVRKHLQHPSRKPVAPHNQVALDTLLARHRAHGGPLWLDDFCGTGQSTITLAQAKPDHLVVGVDQSDHRLQRRPEPLPDNCLLLRAQCEDIWTGLAAAGIRLAGHTFFYPNPWPKAAQLQRRIHGCAAFATLLKLGGCVELRSNWPLYTEEFGVALNLAGIPAVVRELKIDPDAPITLFEAKYARSGHRLWQVSARLP